ncbi:hypothetical protein TraAM80_06925 [Trypanosoma rangeli]|uniref:Uncharacterized protein n=1 Tax=Trypanosoma rangeli TaxID=5698 RepID=A0A3R7M913_TRYRA|nr:uncharacterized protein TraAM80_06925 [Trypanosoma rangeli]RNF01612.1 hypothetical protein TraAM80_06925 [Trypanosoma rangeli]|eukprot:RNF01612.1 hypothetical protein TraAM80_06925 [Trypanosoma rangeli]
MPYIKTYGSPANCDASAMPPEIVEVTSPPRDTAPANSQTEARTIICFSVNTREPYVVPKALARSFIPTPHPVRKATMPPTMAIHRYWLVISRRSPNSACLPEVAFAEVVVLGKRNLARCVEKRKHREKNKRKKNIQWQAAGVSKRLGPHTVAFQAIRELYVNRESRSKRASKSEIPVRTLFAESNVSPIAALSLDAAAQLEFSLFAVPHFLGTAANCVSPRQASHGSLTL